MIAGGKLSLPMPGLRARRGRGPLAVLSLGAFSGVASSCCAPVLAGVLALAGVSGSFSAALVLGTAYVFGIVFPLFVIALLWDRFDWGESRLLRGRSFGVSVLGRKLVLNSTALASGLILLAIGAFSIVLGARGNAMPSSGWQVEISARLQHYAHVLRVWLGGVPGWVTAGIIFALLAGLAWKALGQSALLRGSPEPDATEIASQEPEARRPPAPLVASAVPRKEELS
jgi:hypothetical protein